MWKSNVDIPFFSRGKKLRGDVPRVPEEDPDAKKYATKFVGKPLAQVENESVSSAGSRHAGNKSRTIIFKRSPDRGESASGPAHLHARSRNSAAGTR